MFNSISFGSFFFLTKFIEKKQNVIVGFISKILGFILNLIFIVISNISLANSLGISIILLTIITRTLMLPMAFKQQKSMVSMRRVQPEMEKIKQKYGDTKDPELQRKMNLEIQELYSKYKINPLSSCLPLFITLPIFIALSYLMRQSYLFVTSLGDIYFQIGQTVQSIDGIYDILVPLIVPKIPRGSGITIDIEQIDQLASAFNAFGPEDWRVLIEGISQISMETADTITNLLLEKRTIETFLTIDLVETSGWKFPSVIIPVLSGLTTFLSTWIINKQQEITDPAQKTQQTVMLAVMPVIMALTTTKLASGVGLYWITSNIYQTVQQVLLNKHYVNKQDELVPEVKKQKKEIVEIKNVPKNKKGAK